MRWTKLSILVGSASAAVALSGCGERTTTVVVTRAAPPATATTATATGRAPTHHAQRTMKSCDANIRAKVGTTSCAFAENVFYEFWKALDAGDDAVIAYSPVTGRRYSLACTTGTTVVCTAGDGAEVRFPMSAVDAYDSSQAEAFRCGHQTTADDSRSGCGDDDEAATGASTRAATATPEQDDSGSEDCDPNYLGACVPNDGADYDCAELSASDFESVGSDPDRLDADGDGIACES
jgi:hypothetical protein